MCIDELTAGELLCHSYCVRGADPLEMEEG